MKTSLPTLFLALLGQSFCSAALADTSFTPNHVAVGKNNEITINFSEPQLIDSISLQPAYPFITQKIDLNQPGHAYKIQHKKAGLKLFNEKGQLLAEFPKAAKSIEQAHLRYRANGEQGLIIDKQRGWVKDQQIGQFRTSEPAQDIALTNHLALLATGQGGLTVLDITTPEKPTWLGSHQKLGTTTKVSAKAQRVAVLNDANIIYLVDLKNPSEPTTVSAFRSKLGIHDIYLAGDKVYALTDGQIQVIDFSIESPQISNEGLDFGQGVNLGGERRVFIENKLAYVADWFSGIHIYDISRPRQPELLSSFHTPGSPKGIVVRDGIAYVPDDDHGLAILDVSDPINPKHISTLLTEGLAYTPRLVGDLLYLASHRGGFQIIDVSDVSKPKQLSEFDTEGKAWSMEVHNNIAYVADDDRGLLMFDVSDPTQPMQIGQYNTGAAAEEVIIRDNIAFVAYYDDGLHILDISDPRKVKPISQLAIPGNARGLDLVGNSLYVAGWLSGVHTVDISNPQQPKLLGSYDTRGAAWGLKAEGQHLFVMDWWGGISVIDISDASQPKAVGGYHNRGLIHDIALHDNYAFVAQGSNGLQVFDINNALHPTWTTGTSLPGQALAIKIQDQRAYIAAGDGGLVVIDISNPFNVRWLGRYDSRGELNDLVIDGDYAFASDSLEGLIMFDIRDEIPRKLAELDIVANKLWLHQGKIYMATNNGLKIAERNNEQLRLTQTNRPEQAIQQITTDSQQLYVSSDQQLSIFKLNDINNPVVQIDLAEEITDLEMSEQGLLLSTRYSLFNISPAGKIQAEYPLLTDSRSISDYQGTVYISGEESIAALQPIPHINQTIAGRKSIKLQLPMTLGIGSYKLRVLYNDGRESLISTPLRVTMPKFSKPKMTMEDFKRLMQQEKNSDIFINPVTAEDNNEQP